MNTFNPFFPQIPARRSRSLWLVVLALSLLGVTSCRQETAAVKPDNVDYYTCAMHPSVRSDKPGDHCPICSMELVPVFKKSAMTNVAMNGMAATNPAAMASAATNDDVPGEFTVSAARQQQIGVTFAEVTQKPVQLTLRTVGMVTPDPQRQWDYVARVDGYVKKLFVFSPGEPVEKGAPLLAIYSPDLLASENEFLDLLRTRDTAQTNGSATWKASTEQLIASARERLLLWNITGEQIHQLEQTRQPLEVMTLNSPFKGVVQSLAVEQGGKVSAGDRLVSVTDLSTVWVWAQFYQDDLPLLQSGLPVTITSSTYPGETFEAKIALVDPFLNNDLRSVRARLEVDNSRLKLRPDMYVDAELTIDLGIKLVVPTAAVLPTGRHDIVFVDQGGGRFQPRYVGLGRKFGEDYEIHSGLQAGDRVVASANFLIDAEAKVQGALKSW